MRRVVESQQAPAAQVARVGHLYGPTPCKRERGGRPQLYGGRGWRGQSRIEELGDGGVVGGAPDGEPVAYCRSDAWRGARTSSLLVCAYVSPAPIAPRTKLRMATPCEKRRTSRSPSSSPSPPAPPPPPPSPERSSASMKERLRNRHGHDRDRGGECGEAQLTGGA